METALSRRMRGTWLQTKKQLNAIEKRARESVEEGIENVDDRLAPLRKELNRLPRRIETTWTRLPRQIETIWNRLPKRFATTWNRLPKQLDAGWAKAVDTVRGFFNVAPGDELERLQRRVDDLQRKLDKLSKEKRAGDKIVRLPRK